LGLAACYASLSLLPSLAGLILATLFLTVGEMMLFANANEYLARVVPANKVGRAMGFNAMAVSLALTFSSPTVGYFFANRSPQELWILLCVMALVAAWGFQRLPNPEPGRPHHAGQEPSPTEEPL
jgi:predicted MFS family arabinose efflux permease